MILKNMKQKPNEPAYSFKERFQGIQRIAIIYPEQSKWMRIARYALQNLYNLPEQFDFLLLVPGSSSRPLLNIRHQYANMPYRPNKDDRQSIQTTLATYNPDILFQLEPEPSERLLRAIQSIKIPLKMGFGPEDSGLNVVYSQNKSGFYEKNILNLIGLIETT